MALRRARLQPCRKRLRKTGLWPLKHPGFSGSLIYELSSSFCFPVFFPSPPIIPFSTGCHPDRSGGISLLFLPTFQFLPSGFLPLRPSFAPSASRTGLRTSTARNPSSPFSIFRFLFSVFYFPFSASTSP